MHATSVWGSAADTPAGFSLLLLLAIVTWQF